MICTIDDIFQTFTKITRKTKMEKKQSLSFQYMHTYCKEKVNIQFEFNAFLLPLILALAINLWPVPDSR